MANTQYEDGFYMQISRKLFMGIIKEDTEFLHKEMEKYKKNGNKDSKMQVKKLKELIKYNKDLIRTAEKDDDHLIYFLDRKGELKYFAVPPLLKRTLKEREEEAARVMYA